MYVISNSQVIVIYALGQRSQDFENRYTSIIDCSSKSMYNFAIQSFEFILSPQTRLIYQNCYLAENL